MRTEGGFIPFWFFQRTKILFSRTFRRHSLLVLDTSVTSFGGCNHLSNSSPA